MKIRLYLDEDAMRKKLVAALRSRRIDLVTASDEGLLHRSDEDHLEHATSLGRVLYGYNVKDFFRIHSQFMAQYQHHCGVILAEQTQYSIGEQLRCLSNLIGALDAVEMHDRLEFLSAWNS